METEFAHMDERPFSDKSHKPTEEKLETVLGVTFKYFTTLQLITSTYKNQWNFSKSSGWILKVHDSKKALFYCIPFNKFFKISLTMREKEKVELLSDPDLDKFHGQIKNAKKYTEGYAMQFIIDDERSYSEFKIYIEKLVKKRTS